jgi:2-keto-3-deoxy-L-rhamnonate aldolase RhmA
MPVRKSKVLAKLRSGGAVKCCALGHFLPFFVHYAAESGYDCIWLDLEHRAMDQRELQALLQLGVHHDIDIMVRPPQTEATKLYRLLEDGATGLMIPLQNTAADVQDLVNKVKFPPLGNRGIDAAGVDAGFGSFSWHDGENSMESYVTQSNRETFLCVQIETRSALANVEQIAQVPGLDIMFLGPGDLGWRLKEEAGNTPDAPDHFVGGMPEAVKKVAAAAAAAGCAWGLPVGTQEAAQEKYDQGARFINLGGDFGFIMSGLKDSAAKMDSVYGASTQ